MVRKLVARTLLRLARWRATGTVPRAGILVGAPHTSNWDWVAMLMLMWRDGVEPRVLIKRELFSGPLGPILRATGGVPLDRANPGAVVREMLEHARADDSFVLVLAAEGTRGKGAYWKSGFYRLAQQTGLPIYLGYIDGPSRTLGIGPSLVPTGDLRADMDVVRAFYADKRGVHPERRTEPRLQAEEREAGPGRGPEPG